MIIDYLNKEISKIETSEIVGLNINYEINKEGMDSLYIYQQTLDQPCITRILLHKDNLYDIITDDIENGRVMQGGLTQEGKYILSYYIIEKGLDELLNILSNNT